MQSSRRGATLALALSVLLGTTAAASAASSQVPVKLGVLADMSGIFSDIGGKGALEATRMAVEDFEKMPGGDALKVEVVSADALNKPDISSGIARKWFDSDGVDAVVDLPTSAISLAIAPLVKEKNKVALFTAAGTSDLTGKACTPNSVHWTYDTWALAHGTADAIVKQGGNSWFFLTVDFALGHSLENDASRVIQTDGGKVVGSVRHPTDTKDFSSYLLQAQGSGAKVVALANAGGDTITAIKQASEFGLTDGGQTLAGMLLFLSDIHSLGLQTAQGLQLTTGFYWDENEKTREFAKRFAARNGGRYPTMNHAGAYSATLAYLKAVEKVGSPKDGAAVVKAMRDAGTFDDPLFGKTSLRKDGRVTHPMMLVQVKKPSESTGPYDYYKVLATIPAEQAFHPLADSVCPLAK
ncbi:branched-chain amino acid transport system substrate-binding protein [Azospirillum oryzae]|uniref:Branched-chain amino acid transport system substrate-binding protein n=1 Tax=Azospirillum oryzae TaxID=286727 RepID=A0A1X7HKI4_9PROT|nr:ABC transporter substrate-binding protein [Azospirillum oryzae]SMF88384.1 branched-chain amino acid transport system substrate-binding protein [Azospirillum oryzae]